MRLLKINIKNMPRFREDIDIDFITKQRVAEDDKEKLFHIFSNIYANQVLSFIGINKLENITTIEVIEKSIHRDY